MIYGSVCSGIEAATVAWHPLGWKAAFYSEIEKFPSAVLAHHYPAVRNLGDFTTIKADQHEPIDLLVGGTPCQSFSIAGLRGGLGDDRGNLALEYLRLADRARPRWLVWENVPGVLSSNEGRDFGAILGGMVELGYGVAYRVLDAQFCRVGGFWRAVPQRRRRVFIVGYLGDWRRAAAVLFERASLLGDSAPGRKAGQGIAPTISARPTGGGGLGTDFDCDGGLIHSAAVSPALKARDFKGPSSDGDGAPLVAHALRADGFDASEDGTGRGTPLVPVNFQTRGGDLSIEQGVSGTLGSNADRASGGAPCIAFDCKASGQSGFGVGEVASTMRAMGHSDSHQNGGGHQAVAFNITPSNSNKDYNAREASYAQAVTTDGGAPSARGGDIVTSRWAVRRLTPRECERLQGFPDDYTLIPWRGKEAPDGPRYKALGNSMAVNVMRWIGTRIEMVETLTASVQAA